MVGGRKSTSPRLRGSCSPIHNVTCFTMKSWRALFVVAALIAAAWAMISLSSSQDAPSPHTTRAKRLSATEGENLIAEEHRRAALERSIKELRTRNARLKAIVGDPTPRRPRVYVEREFVGVLPSKLKSASKSSTAGADQASPPRAPVSVVIVTQGLAEQSLEIPYVKLMELVSLLDYPKGLIDLHTMVLSDGTTRGNATAEAIEQASLKWATAYREVRVHKSYWRVSFATLSDEERKRYTSIGRNIVAPAALRHTKYTLWIDANVISLPSSLLKDWVAARKPAVTTLTGSRASAGTPPQEAYLFRRSLECPQLTYTRQLLLGADAGKNSTKQQCELPGGKASWRDLTPAEKRDLELQPVTRVRTPVMLIDSEVYRQGFGFSPYKNVGTEWDRKEGGSGLGTEGLCYELAVVGLYCWGSPAEVKTA